MKKCYSNLYTLADGAVVFFNHKKLKAAIYEKKKGLEKCGQKCSQQRVLEQIAEETSISISAIKHWCSGRHAPSDLNKIRDIASALDVHMSDLLVDVYDDQKEGYAMNVHGTIVKTNSEIWNEVKKVLSETFSPTAMNVWFADCKLVAVTDHSFVLRTTSDFKKTMIQSRFSGKILQILTDLYSWTGEVVVLAG